MKVKTNPWSLQQINVKVLISMKKKMTVTNKHWEKQTLLGKIEDRYKENVVYTVNI